MVTSPLPFPGTSPSVNIRSLLVMPCDERSCHHSHQPLCLSSLAIAVAAIVRPAVVLAIVVRPVLR